MPHRASTHNALATFLLTLVAGGAIWFQARLAPVLVPLTRDMLAPGRQGLQYLEQTLQAQWEGWQAQERVALESEVAAAQAERDRWRREAHSLSAQVAHLQAELEALHKLGNSPYAGNSGPPLFVPQLLEARICGRESALETESGLLVDAGRDDAIVPEAWVLEREPLLDQGSESQVETGQPVYAGAAVVGRVASVGRLTSSVQLITDAQYRGRAQLARQTSQGTIFGQEGQLCGQGTPLCVLKSIPATESVAVGDLVFTGGRNASMPYPLFYGHVVAAELPPGADEWNIQVEPAVRPERITTVQVLRASLNPVRVLGQ